KALVNCFRKRASFSLNIRISFTSYNKRAGRSIPIPNANPVYLLLSILQLSKTLGCTMPQPNISTQPVCLQMRQPLPPQIKQVICLFPFPLSVHCWYECAVANPDSDEYKKCPAYPVQDDSPVN